MRNRLLAVVAGVVVMLAVLGVSFAVTDAPPEAVDEGNVEVPFVDRVVALIAPTLTGGDCPDVTRPAPRRAIDATDRLVLRVRRTPEAEVPSPDGSGVDIPLSDVPSILADEVDGCILQAPGPAGEGWEAITRRLRGG